MAHKKGVGSSKNGRESHSKRLGLKLFMASSGPRPRRPGLTPRALSQGSGRAPLLTQGPRPARVRGAGGTVLALLLLKFMIGFEIHPLATEQIASPILH